MIGIYSLILVVLLMRLLFLSQQVQELAEQLQDRIEHPENYIDREYPEFSLKT